MILRNVGEGKDFRDNERSSPIHVGIVKEDEEKRFLIQQGMMGDDPPIVSEKILLAILAWGSDPLAWIGKRVEQVRSDCAEHDKYIGRKGTVTETMFDEKGQVHCKTESDNVWCPAKLLEEVT